MVATRRQAQAGPDEELVAEQDPDQILKKKTSRKAPSTKPAATGKAMAQPKASARGKKVEQETLEETAVKKPAAKAASLRGKKTTTASVPEEGSVAGGSTSKASKAASLRATKRTAAVEAAQSEPEPDPTVSKPARATKAASLRGKKDAALPDNAPAEESTKQTRTARAGSTRAKEGSKTTTAPDLPAPEQAKSTRSTRGTVKAAPLSPKKITQVSKAPSRAPKNTEKPAMTKGTRAKAAVKTTLRGKRRAVSDENADIPDFDVDPEDVDNGEIAGNPPMADEAVSSPKLTRAAAQAVAESEASMSSRPTTPSDSPAHSFDAVENEADAADHVDSESELVGSVNGDASEDELCGPKTPMRRSSPSAQAWYQSTVQRTIRKYEEDARLETPAIRYAVLGTQKGTPQTQKPYCKPSAPSSAVRPMTISRATGRAFIFKDLRAETTPSAESNPAFDDQGDISFLPDDAIIPIDTHEDAAEPTSLQAPTQPVVEIDAESLVEEDAEDYVVPCNVQKYGDDPDDTVIIHDTGEPSPMKHPFTGIGTNLLEQGDVVGNLEESDEDSVIAIPINHIAGNGIMAHTIPINFEEHLRHVRPAAWDTVMHLDDMSIDIPATMDEHDAEAGAQMDIDEHAPMLEDVDRRQTVNFNDFIDVGALTEPTQQLQLDGDVAFPVNKDHRDVDSHVVDTGVVDAAVTQEAHEMQMDEPTFEEMANNDTAEEDQVGPACELATTNLDGGSGIVEELPIPHYALPTMAFDARRKSLPALLHPYTPVKTTMRPSTSDGASMPRIRNPFVGASGTLTKAENAASTPIKTRPSTAHATPKTASWDAAPSTPVVRNIAGQARTVAARARFATPVKESPNRRKTFHKAMPGKITLQDTQSVVSTPASVVATTSKERYPALRPRANYEEHATTVAAPVRFQNVLAQSPNRRQTFHKALPGRTNDTEAEPEISTPETVMPITPEMNNSERYPCLRPQVDYEDHAKTVAGPPRFQTPAKRALKRPATVGKSDAMQRAALAANTSTPLKTPLKAPAMTPAQVPMTPHPAAPLQGVVALVEVFTLEGASASAPFVALLHRLGAKTTRSWNDRITHVVFKDGSPTTLQRVRLNNKDFESTGQGPYIHCVNSRWVTDCDAAGARMDEADEVYTVDVAEIPRGGKRRRKSMEPAALLNLGGNIVRDRKSSGGRISSFGRSPLKLAESSPAKTDSAPDVAPSIDVMGKENSGDEQSSPATPAWIAAPEQLVQQTAPMKRVRKLELPGKGDGNSRRLTFWSGMA